MGKVQFFPRIAETGNKCRPTATRNADTINTLLFSAEITIINLYTLKVHHSAVSKLAQTEFLAMLEYLVVKNNEFSLSLHEQWCPQLHVAIASLAGHHTSIANRFSSRCR